MIHVKNSTCAVITTKCTLNCKFCLNYQPYIKDRRHYDIADIKSDIDLFFGIHDKVDYFSLTGGEPFLHQGLGELLQYIHGRYGYKLLHLGTATNGTIVPSDDLCRILKECRVELLCNRYPLSSSYDDLMKQCRKYDVHCIEGGKLSFFITYPPFADCGMKPFAEKYLSCKSTYSGYGIKNGRIYYCCYSMFADTAGICESEPSDYYDMRNADPQSLTEFHLGVPKKGYVRFCGFCNGWPPENNHYDPNGVTQTRHED